MNMQADSVKKIIEENPYIVSIERTDGSNLLHDAAELNKIDEQRLIAAQKLSELAAMPNQKEIVGKATSHLPNMSDDPNAVPTTDVTVEEQVDALKKLIELYDKRKAAIKSFFDEEKSLRDKQHEVDEEERTADLNSQKFYDAEKRKNILEEVKEFYSKSYEVNLLTSFDENKNPIYTLQNTTVNIPTKEELTELKTYLINFKEDIDNHFKFWNFMKFEWYYPIRNKFFFKIKKLILNRK